MSESINGSLLKKINDSVVRLETQWIAVTGTLVEIKGILTDCNKKCDTTCEKNENRFGSIMSQLKAQWWVVGLSAAGLIGFAFFIFKAVIK